MLNPWACVLGVCALASLSGCATVSVYQPSSASAEISLTASESELYKAADAYCDQAVKKGWSTGETDLAGISAVLNGRGDADAYWRKIGADKNAPNAVLARVRADSGEAAKGLVQLNTMAQKLMATAKVSKTDVSEFEKALIHGRQARDSFFEAISEFNKHVTHEVEPAVELDGLDKALASARSMADDLAAARASGVIASLS